MKEAPTVDIRADEEEKKTFFGKMLDCFYITVGTAVISLIGFFVFAFISEAAYNPLAESEGAAENIVSEARTSLLSDSGKDGSAVAGDEVFSPPLSSVSTVSERTTLKMVTADPPGREVETSFPSDSSNKDVPVRRSSLSAPFAAEHVSAEDGSSEESQPGSVASAGQQGRRVARNPRQSRIPTLIPVVPGSISQSYHIGDQGPDVQAAQVLLNQTSCPVAQSGPGFKGGETIFFGNLTAGAVICYQEIKGLRTTGELTPDLYDLLVADYRSVLTEAPPVAKPTETQVETSAVPETTPPVFTIPEEISLPTVEDLFSHCPPPIRLRLQVERDAQLVDLPVEVWCSYNEYLYRSIRDLPSDFTFDAFGGTVDKTFCLENLPTERGFSATTRLCYALLEGMRGRGDSVVFLSDDLPRIGLITIRRVFDPTLRR